MENKTSFVPFRKFVGSHGWIAVGPLIQSWAEENHSHIGLDPRAWDALAENRLVCGWLRGVERVCVVADGPEAPRSEVEQLVMDWVRENGVVLVDEDETPPREWLPGH